MPTRTTCLYLFPAKGQFFEYVFHFQTLQWTLNLFWVFAKGGIFRTQIPQNGYIFYAQLFQEGLIFLSMNKHGYPHTEVTPPPRVIGTFRSLRFTVGWPLKSCTHTGIFPSVSGHPTVKRKPRKVPNNGSINNAVTLCCVKFVTYDDHHEFQHKLSICTSHVTSR